MTFEEPITTQLSEDHWRLLFSMIDYQSSEIKELRRLMTELYNKIDQLQNSDNRVDLYRRNNIRTSERNET